MAFANGPRTGLRIPGWLLFLVILPLQIWIIFHLWDAWRWWQVLLFLLLLGIMGNRAARAPWLTQMLFPGHAYRHEVRRHVFQGLLFLGAALTWYLPMNASLFPSAAGWPTPWLPLAFLATLLKAALR